MIQGVFDNDGFTKKIHMHVIVYKKYIPILSIVQVYLHSIISRYVYTRGVGTGLAGPVLAGQLFRVKTQFHFYKRQEINRIASTIFRLFRLLYYFITDRKSLSIAAKLSAAHA